MRTVRLLTVCVGAATYPPSGHTHPLDISTPRSDLVLAIPTPNPWKGPGTSDTHLPLDRETPPKTLPSPQLCWRAVMRRAD